MIKLFNYSLSLLLLAFICSTTLSIAQEGFNEIEIRKLVDEISVYEYGKDRSPLSKFQTSVVNSINNPSELSSLF